MNETFQNNPSNAYTVNNYFRQEEIRKEEEKKEETILTRQMKKQFSFFAPPASCTLFSTHSVCIGMLRVSLTLFSPQEPFAISSYL